MQQYLKTAQILGHRVASNHLGQHIAMEKVGLLEQLRNIPKAFKGMQPGTQAAMKQYGAGAAAGAVPGAIAGGMGEDAGIGSVLGGALTGAGLGALGGRMAGQGMHEAAKRSVGKVYDQGLAAAKRLGKAGPYMDESFPQLQQMLQRAEGMAFPTAGRIAG